METNTLIYAIVRIALLVLTIILLASSVIVTVAHLISNQLRSDESPVFQLMSTFVVVSLAGAYSSWYHERTYLIVYGLAMITLNMCNRGVPIVQICYVGVAAIALIQSELIRKGFHQASLASSPGFTQHLSPISIE